MTVATGIELISISYSQDDEEEEEGEGEGKNEEQDEGSPLQQNSDSSSGTYIAYVAPARQKCLAFPVVYLLTRGKWLGRLKAGVYN